MVVDLPTPGTPVMPTRTAWPVCGSRSCTSRRAAFWWSARPLSMSVMARASDGALARGDAAGEPSRGPALPVGRT